MMDKIQFLLSLQILGFCIFGGTTLLLRAHDNRAKRILGWGMFLWAFLTGVRLSVNLYVEETKEAFHPDVLLIGCFVTATLACYVIEVLRPGFLTLKRFFVFVSPIFLLAFLYLGYRISGDEVHVYYSLAEVVATLNTDGFLRLSMLALTLFYMSLPACLVIRYSKQYTMFLYENVSDPEDYDLDWLKKIMIILSAMYVVYLILLFTDIPFLYVVNKAAILVIWYYFFYKALFLKVFVLEYSFKDGWDLPYSKEEETDAVRKETDDEQRILICKRYAPQVKAWFEKEKPYLREDLRLTDLQRVFPLSRSYLSQLFNRELGQSFSDYVNRFRIEESKRLLETEPAVSIQEIAERSGFHSISTFRRAFQKYTGMVPSEYKRG